MKHSQLVPSIILSIAIVVSAALMSSSMKREPAVSRDASVMQSATAAGVPSRAPVPTTQSNIVDLLPADEKLITGDVLEVTVNDLRGPGQESTRIGRIGNNGMIRLTYVGNVQAAGGTSEQLENSVADAFEKQSILSHAVVTVTARRPAR